MDGNSTNWTQISGDSLHLSFHKEYLKKAYFILFVESTYPMNFEIWVPQKCDESYSKNDFDSRTIYSQVQKILLNQYRIDFWFLISNTRNHFGSQNQSLFNQYNLSIFSHSSVYQFVPNFLV